MSETDLPPTFDGGPGAGPDLSNDVNAVLGAAGAGEMFPAGGRDWHVVPATQKDHAQFASWVRMRARMFLVADRPLMDQNLYREEMDAFTASAWRYQWGREYVNAALGDDDALMYLFYLMLRHRHPEVTPARARELYDEGGDAAANALASAARASDPKLFAREGADGTTTRQATR